MPICNTNRASIDLRQMLVAAVVGLGLVVASALATEARTATTGENDLVKAGHRYMLYLDEGFDFTSGEADNAAPQGLQILIPENHRIAQLYQ